MTPPWDESAWYGMSVPAGLSADRPDLDVVYGGGPAFDPTRLLVEDYIGGPLAIRGRAMPHLANWTGGPPYRLLLHALLAGLEIGRVDIAGPIMPGIPVLSELRPLLPRLCPGCEAVPGLLPGTAELRRRFPIPPPVTVLYDGRVPDFTATDWPGNALSALSYHAGLDSAWRAATTEYLVLLAPGMQPQGPNWLRALLTLAAEEGTGLVGATPGAPVQHEALMLPFRAIVTRPALLAELGGFDLHHSQDVALADLCLRVRQLGLRVAGTPHAAVVGPERPVLSPVDRAWLRLKWPTLLVQDSSAWSCVVH